MKITVKTQNWYLIKATGKEIETLTSVSGLRPKSIKIGQKISVIDYAATATRIKILQDNYTFKQFFSRNLDDFDAIAKGLKTIVLEARSEKK